MKSKPPKNMAVIKETPMTIKVYLIACSLLGQLIFFTSRRTSFRKVTILEGRFFEFMVFKKPKSGPSFQYANKTNSTRQTFFQLKFGAWNLEFEFLPLYI